VLLTIVCPLCRFAATVPDTARGRTVRCLKCQKRSRVPAAVGLGCATGTPTAPATAARADVQEPLEAVEVIKSDVAEEPPQPAEAQGKG
jgi:hypothetical protein